MAQGCAGTFATAMADLGVLRQRCRSVLADEGCKVGSRRKSPDGFKLEGTQGNWFLGVVTSFFPFLSAAGVFSLQQVELVARRSLNEGDDSIRVMLRVAPRGEWTGQKESFLLGQSMEEYIGDNLRSRILFAKLRDALREAGVIESDTA